MRLKDSPWMDNFEEQAERLELLEAIYNLAALIEQSRDINKISHYVDQLSELKRRLVALGPPPPRTKANKAAE